MSIQIGDHVRNLLTSRRGRVVSLFPGNKEIKAHAWIEKTCADGTVERECCWLTDLTSEKRSDGNG